MFRVDHEDVARGSRGAQHMLRIVAGGSRGLKYIFKQIIVYSDGHRQGIFIYLILTINL